MTARPSGADCAPPSPKPIAIGIMPKIIAAAVIRIARRRLLAPSRAASNSGVSFAPRMLGEGDQQNRVGDRDADRHDRAHERLNVQRGAGEPQHQQHAAQHRGNGQHDGQRQADGLEVGGQQQEDHQNRQQQTDAQAGDGLFQRRNLAAVLDAHAFRRSARAGQRRVQLLRRFAQRHAVDVGGER